MLSTIIQKTDMFMFNLKKCLNTASFLEKLKLGTYLEKCCVFNVRQYITLLVPVILDGDEKWKNQKMKLVPC